MSCLVLLTIIFYHKKGKRGKEETSFQLFSLCREHTAGGSCWELRHPWTEHRRAQLRGDADPAAKGSISSAASGTSSSRPDCSLCSRLAQHHEQLTGNKSLSEPASPQGPTIPTKPVSMMPAPPGNAVQGHGDAPRDEARSAGTCGTPVLPGFSGTKSRS